MLSSLCNACCCPVFGALLAVLAWVLYKLADRHFRRQTEDIPADERTVLITGCDTGFGRLLAMRLSAKGWCVFAGCLTQKAVDELGRGSGGGNLVPVQMDVSSAESVRTAVLKINETLGQRGLRGLRGLVNNAGVSGSKLGPTEFMTQEDFHEVFAVNVYGVANVTRACLPLMRRLKRSRLVNISSIFGRFAMAGTAPYCASKFCVQAMSDCYRRELRQFGCHVACLEPGFHRTAITDKASLTRAIDKAFDNAPAILKDAYGEEYQRQSIKTLDDVLGMCSDRLDQVVDAYEEALTSKHPRCRYMVGRDARFFYWPLTVLPEWVADTLVAMRTPKAAGAVA